ncbi:MAG: hypothetical protein GY909_16995 [Oligoflexia bacterium]|nr:hypothetical protein [Oligoflexia bacterium]
MEASLFDRIGGKDSVKALVNELYTRTLNDPDLLPFFQDLIDSPLGIMKLKEKQEKNLQYILGSSNGEDYDLEFAHAELVDKGLNETHYQKLAQHFKDSLDELKVEDDIQQIIMGKLNDLQDVVLGK